MFFSQVKKNILGLCFIVSQKLFKTQLATPTPIIQLISNHTYYQYFLQALTPASTFTLKLLVDIVISMILITIYPHEQGDVDQLQDNSLVHMIIVNLTVEQFYRMKSVLELKQW